jgi:sigma-B regulation protein RsbU (phosphoserine phosphatase)
VVSGDYVDVVTTEGAAGDLLVLVGDVSGKGIAAALLMSHLHAAFRSMSASGSGLVDMVHKANRLFYASTTSNAFATLTAVSLQSDGRVELCNAGHTPALLITTDGVEEISASSVPLGMFSEAEFTSRSLKLEPGSTMLLYTDGLTESASHDDVELEVEGVRAVLEANRGEGPSNLVSTLADNEANHRSGVEPHDDLTIMAISRQAGRA